MFRNQGGDGAALELDTLKRSDGVSMEVGKRETIPHRVKIL
jgi:hypothetical protein